MRIINFYSFHRNIPTHRFDNHNSEQIYYLLSENFKVNRYEYDGADKFEFNGILIDHGSILIFEYDDTKQFKVYDFGDNPYLTVQLSKLDNFAGAILGQYNPHYWNSIITDPEIRNTICGGIYPESVWQLGMLNYDTIQEHRSNLTLNDRLYWRGSLYNHNVPDNYIGIRKSIELLPNILSEDQLYFGNYPLPFDQYISEVVSFKLALSIGGGGGVSCGDFCFRDIEMFGLGVPLIRPTYIVESMHNLIPNYHYIAVDADFDENYRYKNHEQLAVNIAEKYKQVINDDSLLKMIASNARQWYIDNISYPNITNNIIKLLNL